DGSVLHSTVATESGTIRLVEDEEWMRQLASEYLSGKGDRVLIAADPASAVTLAAAHLGLIGMLLTDVILPGMSGVRLAESLAPAHPGMRVLYVSGYTAGARVQPG